MEARSNLQKNVYFQVIEQPREFAATGVRFQKTEHYLILSGVWMEGVLVLI